MRNSVVRRERVEKLVSITCDVCKVDYPDVMDQQEFLSYSDVGGYGSKIGDGTLKEVDICESCVQTLLGPWLRTYEEC